LRKIFCTCAEPIQLALRERGYIEGQNIAIEYRYAEGKPDRLPALAAELVRLKVDLIVVSGEDLVRRGQLFILDIRPSVSIKAHMARALQIQIAGGCYHVTCRGNERKAIYHDDTDRQVFLDKLQASLTIYQVELHAFVLMDNIYNHD
jgi:hypothetical protein